MKTSWISAGILALTLSVSVVGCGSPKSEPAAESAAEPAAAPTAGQVRLKGSTGPTDSPSPEPTQDCSNYPHGVCP